MAAYNTDLLQLLDPACDGKKVYVMVYWLLQMTAVRKSVTVVFCHILLI